MVTRAVAGLLILLTLFTQLDDGVWVLSAVRPSQTATDEDDYVSTQRQQEGQPASRRDRSPGIGLNARAANALTARAARLALAMPGFTELGSLSPLYAF